MFTSIYFQLIMLQQNDIGLHHTFPKTKGKTEVGKWRYAAGWVHIPLAYERSVLMWPPGVWAFLPTKGEHQAEVWDMKDTAGLWHILLLSHPLWRFESHFKDFSSLPIRNTDSFTLLFRIILFVQALTAPRAQNGGNQFSGCDIFSHSSSF